MIRMSHVHSNISITAKWELSIVNFTGFWGFVVLKIFLISQMVNLIVFLKNKGKDSVKED
jgi:hypothetical protein